MNSQPYRYALVDQGFEIVNGDGLYNRPLYGPHCRDLDNFEERVLAIVGDVPNVLLTLINWRGHSSGGGCGAVKLGHLFFGLQSATGGRWFESFAGIKARYVPGREEYELSDPEFSGTLRLTFVRPVEFEGLLARVQFPPELQGGRLLIACGGATKFTGGQFDYQGGRGSSKDFHAEDCELNLVTLGTNSFQVWQPQDEHQKTLHVAASVKLDLRVADASDFAGPMDGFLASEAGGQPMALAGCAADAGGEVYVALTTDDLADEHVQDFLSRPSQVFDACTRYYQQLSETVRIDTPDPYLNLGLAAQILGQDGAWHEPCFTHGPWSWTAPYAGWRICYGATVLGWHDRVQSSAAEFFPLQVKAPEEPTIVWRRPGGYNGGAECGGAVPCIARTSDIYYNMGEVLVDHILYDWEWTGDLQFMAKAFDFVSEKLLWEERLLDPDGDGLYENWLNTWISDAHWYNGGGCIQASAYNWRANMIMADVAERLGKDGSVFAQRAKTIKQACENILWVAETGVYAEYKDAIGHQRLHEAPEQASIYHPIDFRLCDELQAYQMLRYSEYAIPNEYDTVPRGGRLVWSSNWSPLLYSSMGLYPQETINLLLCYYRLGLAEKAEALMRGLEASFFMGPCPGALAHNQKPDGSHFGSTDFTDTTSMFIRTVVEGLFGVQMNVPDSLVTVQPCFPREWDRACMQAPDITCEYTWDGETEQLCIHTPRALRYRIRLMARTSLIDAVKVDHHEAEYNFEPGIGCTWVVIETDERLAALVEVTYTEAELSLLDYDPVAAIGEDYEFSAAHGEIVELSDPQGIFEDPRIDGAGWKVRVKGAAGWHTFFVLLKDEQMLQWAPVDIELRAAIEISEPKLWVEGGRVRFSCALLSNMQQDLVLSGEIEVGGSRLVLEQLELPGQWYSEELALTISDPGALYPGSNRVVATLEGNWSGTVQTNVTHWQLAGECPAVAKTLAARAKMISLEAVLNQELIHLHDNSYQEPRPGTYSIMAKENGRSEWDWNASGYCTVAPDTGRLGGTGGTFISDVAVPFAVPDEGPNACFTSIWTNFPARVSVPVGCRGRKVYFLVVAATHPMQSQLENGRITVNFVGGQVINELANPQHLDDWLCTPFALSGSIQYLGEKTHGIVLDIDLGQDREITGIEFECLSNEVLLGLVGVTVA